ncbi:MAG: hypothetical protein ACI35W_00480 [Anaeroplasmataceae bacterium]
MKKYFKIIITLIIMFTFAFTITACKSTNNDDDIDVDSITTSDVFQKINITLMKAGMKTSSITYEQLSSSSGFDPDKCNSTQINLYASYKFEVSRIKAKFQSSYTDHTISDGYELSVANGKYSMHSNPFVRDQHVSFKSSEDFNKQHSIEYAFSSGELVIEKGKILFLWVAGGKDGYTTWSNVEIYGKVIK